MDEEHFKLKTKFSNFFFFFFFFCRCDKHSFYQKLQFSGISQKLCPHLSYRVLQKKQKNKLFCETLILQTRVKVKLHPLEPPISESVMANFSGYPYFNACFEKLEKGKQ